MLDHVGYNEEGSYALLLKSGIDLVHISLLFIVGRNSSLVHEIFMGRRPSKVQLLSVL
jgi:hypothetical protein